MISPKVSPGAAGSQVSGTARWPLVRSTKGPGRQTYQMWLYWEMANRRSTVVRELLQTFFDPWADLVLPRVPLRCQLCRNSSGDNWSANDQDDCDSTQGCTVDAGAAPEGCIFSRLAEAIDQSAIDAISEFAGTFPFATYSSDEIQRLLRVASPYLHRLHYTFGIA